MPFFDQTNWNILQADEDKISALQNDLKINRTLCKILVQRGIKTFDEAKNFFARSYLSFIALADERHGESGGKGLKRLSAMKNTGFGDYDVDGTTAVASMYRF